MNTPRDVTKEITKEITIFSSIFHLKFGSKLLYRTAEATGQDIIDPRETRAVLCEFVEDAQRILASQLGPPAIPFLP